jgi:hypothetical protein
MGIKKKAVYYKSQRVRETALSLETTSVNVVTDIFL